MDKAAELPALEPRPLFKKRIAKAITRKRPVTPPPASDSDSGYSTEGEPGQRVKRRKKIAAVTARSGQSSKPSNTDLATSTFSADRSTEISKTNDATKHSNWFDETDASQLLGSSRSKKKDTAPSTSATSVTDAQKLPSKTVGPQKAPANVRMITIMDMAPDVCKDYKQTGFCGFGDSCKFLHAREDYKQGWELDRDWEIGSKSKSKSNTSRPDPDDSDDEDALLRTIPFACIICKSAYRSPIVTKCGHYFCEACALDRYRKNPNCAACGAGTMGVFNSAKQLKRILEKKRERGRMRREKAREAGEEVSSEEEEEGKGDG